MHCAVPESQILEIEAFVEKFFLDKKDVNASIETTSHHSDLYSWIKWKTPDLTK